MYEINHDTFKQLWDEHFRPLVYLCRKYKVNNEAEDIVSDKFTKLWEKRCDFNAPQKVKGFLYLSVMNAIRNQWRTIGRIVEFDYSDDIDTSMMCEEIEYTIIKTIHEEIEKLSPVCKSVFKKRVLEGKSYAQIGNELKILSGTVDNHYQRARTLLRKRIRYEF